MHVANVSVNKNWKNLEDLISEKTGSEFTFDSSKNYYLTNCGGFPVLFLNQENEPAESDMSGLKVDIMEQCGLKLTTGKVFTRCLPGITDIHIEVEE